MTLGLLDFLAYYVPGFLTLLFIIVINKSFGLELGRIVDFVNEFKNEGYIQGATWTLIFLVVPYVIGQLIFPVGYFIARWRYKAVPMEGIGPLPEQCGKMSEYCEPESRNFAACLFKCLKGSDAGFYDLMITRFRTLSRFCRSMLLPTVLIAVALFILAVDLCSNKRSGESIFALVASGMMVFAFEGLGRRHKKYEIRWRNGVCIGGMDTTNHIGTSSQS